MGGSGVGGGGGIDRPGTLWWFPLGPGGVRAAERGVPPGGSHRWCTAAHRGRGADRVRRRGVGAPSSTMLRGGLRRSGAPECPLRGSSARGSDEQCHLRLHPDDLPAAGYLPGPRGGTRSHCARGGSEWGQRGDRPRRYRQARNQAVHSSCTGGRGPAALRYYARHPAPPRAGVGIGDAGCGRGGGGPDDARQVQHRKSARRAGEGGRR